MVGDYELELRAERGLLLAYGERRAGQYSPFIAWPSPRNAALRMKNVKIPQWCAVLVNAA